MTLTKLEQSAFILETSTGFRLGMDIAKYTPVEKLEGVHVDAMIVSHIHGDHFSLEQIRKLNPKTLYINQECLEEIGEETVPFEIIVVKAGDTVSIGNATVHIFNVDHGPNVSAPIKENFGFLIEADGLNIYFAGDMFYPSGIDVAGLSVDYALIPVGGHYTFGPNEALEFAKTFKHIAMLLPMHYENNPGAHQEFINLAKNAFNLI
ncbi:MAG: hypothetical protein JWM20_67 [Patescibacteria group bacterium]|nr:hypothetical protein [Patescibacteria group bacterium]